jgi:hypothetical protein
MFADVRLYWVRYNFLGHCRPHPRVELGGWIMGDGVSLNADGACLAQHWCDDPLAAESDDRIYCRLPETHTGRVSHLVASPRHIMLQNTADRCALVSAICTARGYVELPTFDPLSGAQTSVLLELWPPPDGSSATAVVCSSRCRFQMPSPAWTSAAGGPAITSASYRIAPDVCSLTRLVLAPTAMYEMPLTPPQAVLNQTHTMYRAAAWRVDSRHLGISIDARYPDPSFCIRWYFQPLAMRGARVVAINGFAADVAHAVSSTTCVQLPQLGLLPVTTVLLQTDAVPEAVGSRVGLGPAMSNVSWLFGVSPTPVNSLPYGYRVAAPHPLAYRIPQQARPTAVYDTRGVLRALIPPNMPTTTLILDGWMPACTPYCNDSVVFADNDSQTPTLCYNRSITLSVPVQLAASSTLVHLLGSTVQSGTLPGVALTPAAAPLYTLTSSLAVNGSDVVCGGNTYRVPLDVPATHCVPTAGPLNTGTISTMWHNASGVLSSSTFDDCDLYAYTSAYGTHIAPSACVPMTPGTQLTFANFMICATENATLATLALSPAAAEISRQLGFTTSEPPYLYAVV